MGNRKPKQSLLPLAGAIPALGLAVALVIGIQLGGISWRYRKQLWQLQGAVIGIGVGYVVGRLNRSQVPE
jgi:uncharacterized membrane-anchored protein YhcB (DUF1043 family)